MRHKLFADPMFRPWWQELILVFFGGAAAFLWVSFGYCLAIYAAELLKWTSP